MYLPAHFTESRVEVLHQLIHAHPLAALVTLGTGGLTANHIPFEISPEPAPFVVIDRDADALRAEIDPGDDAHEVSSPRPHMPPSPWGEGLGVRGVLAAPLQKRSTVVNAAPAATTQARE